MGKEKDRDNTEEIIRQLQKTRQQLASSLYDDFFAAPKPQGSDGASAKNSEQPSDRSASSASAKAPVQAATGPAPRTIDDQPKAAEPEEDPMVTLNNLIGLDKIKHDVRELTNFARIQKARKDAGLKTVPVSLHLVFTGNPGTGKTTVARILAKLYKQIGILSKGQLIEVDRSGLVAGYVGQTAIKTQEQIQKALGGVLFIDEAYSLVSKTDDFGQESIDTILKAMEDHRDDLIVIVAGYTQPMERFINSNPGLKSRFNKYIEFPDYTIDELMAIFDLNLKKYDYIIEESARTHIREKLSLMKLSSLENFANARAVRNLFEEIITNQASRIASMKNPTLQDLKTITNDDLTDAEDEAIQAKALSDSLAESAEKPEDQAQEKKEPADIAPEKKEPVDKVPEKKESVNEASPKAQAGDSKRKKPGEEET